MEALSGRKWDGVVDRIPVRTLGYAAATVVGLAVIRKLATLHLMAIPASERTRATVVALSVVTAGGRLISSSDFPDLPVARLDQGIETYLKSVEHLHTPEQMVALRVALKDRKLKVAHAMVVLWAIHCAGWVTSARHLSRFMSEQPSYAEGLALLTEARAALATMDAPSGIGLEVKSSNGLRPRWSSMAYLINPMIDTMWWGNQDKLVKICQGEHPRAVRAAYMLDSHRELWEDKLRCGARELACSMPFPLDMWQHNYLGAVEYPGPKHNMLKDNRGNRGVVIVSNGIPCFVERIPSTPGGCYKLIRAIEKKTAAMTPQKVNVLTLMSGGDGHDAWEQLCAIGDNRRKGDQLRSRVFTLHLSDIVPTTLTEGADGVFGVGLLDKWGGSTVSAVVNAECTTSFSSHAACEATAVSNTKRFEEAHDRRYGTIVDGQLVMPDLAGKAGDGPVAFEPIVFETDAALDRTMKRVEGELRTHLEKRNYHAVRSSALNKEVFKARGFSPDFVMQFSIQVAYFRKFGKFTKTYQTMTTRTFHEGRTETLRSCTPEMAEAVRAFCGGGGSSDKITVLKTAADAHNTYKKMLLDGEGFERTFQAMLAMTTGTEHKPDLYDTEVWNSEWGLPTSQTPTNTLGGGFITWTKDGFAVSYCQDHKDEVTIHVAGSKERSHSTTAEVFASDIVTAMSEVKALLPLKSRGS